MSADEAMSDYTDAESPEQQMIPAQPIKKGQGKKAGGFGRKPKVFATVDRMLQFVDQINAVQEEKVNLLLERDVLPLIYVRCFI